MPRMNWTETIDIRGNIHDVFAAFTNGQKALARSPDILEFWEISATPGLVGSQSGWLFLQGRHCLEVIETLTEQNPPKSIQSDVLFTRLLPLPREMLRKHEFAIVGDELESIFRATYGRKQPTGQLRATFEEIEGGTCITQSFDLQLGGTVGFFNRLSKLAKRSPFTHRLELFREKFEQGSI